MLETPGDAGDRVWKLAPLIILAVRGGAGTIIWTPEYRRCGMDLTDVLRAYVQQSYSYVEPYVELLRGATSV